MRVISYNVETRNATWKLDSGERIVTMPFKYEILVEVFLDCGKDSKSTVIDVPGILCFYRLLLWTNINCGLTYLAII